MVDREKVIDALQNAVVEGGAIKMSTEVRDIIVELLRNRRGYWKGFTQSRYFGMDDDGEPIFRDGLFYVCSECRRKSIIKHPYCPRCGAKMDEEVDERCK